MKLFYYRMPNGAGNFGDDLNPWLWNQLIPDLIDDDERIAFVGIGTLLNANLPRKTRHAVQRVVFGTGVGYGDRHPLVLDESYRIYCVRGPLSAQALGLPSELAVTDAAALIRNVISPPAVKRYRFSYIPHFELAGPAWVKVCRRLGMQYIDPGQPIPQILTAIGETEVLLAEAMHGAIIADALRVPWIPVVTNPSILAFKWQDWCASLDLDYNPVALDRLHHPRATVDWLTPARRVRDRLRQAHIARALRQICQTARPQLSTDAKLAEVTERLNERLEQLKADWASGQLSQPSVPR